MASLRMGPSLDKCTDMGPVVDQRQFNDVTHHIERAPCCVQRVQHLRFAIRKRLELRHARLDSEDLPLVLVESASLAQRLPRIRALHPCRLSVAALHALFSGCQAGKRLLPLGVPADHVANAQDEPVRLLLQRVHTQSPLRLVETQKRTLRLGLSSSKVACPERGLRLGQRGGELRTACVAWRTPSKM